MAHTCEWSTLCPSCGSRPHWLTTLTKNTNIVEQNWWCSECFALITSVPQVPDATRIRGRHVDARALNMN